VLEEPEMPHWKPRQERQEQPAPAVTPVPNDVGTQFIAPSAPIASSIPDTPATSDVSNLFIDDDETASFPQDNPWLTVTQEETGTKPPMLSRLWQSHIPHLEPDHPTHEPAQNDAQPSESQTVGAQFIAPSTASTPGEPLIGQTLNFQQSRRLPRLRVVGQLSQSYIVTEGEDGMYLIDQHAAHERILLERMVAAMKARAPISQHLLTPIKLELAPNELEAIEDHQQQLTHIGFTLEIPDGKTLMVQAVPSVLVKHMNTRSLHELLIDLTAPENLGHTETWEERALANVACKAAIKANYFLTTSEMREMLEQLEQTQAPYSCCHGRPTMIHFSLSALEREFGRR
jgi:DNA mismatch repair protein MutL